jgi:hypothetical protein
VFGGGQSSATGASAFTSPEPGVLAAFVVADSSLGGITRGGPPLPSPDGFGEPPAAVYG